MVSFLGGKHRSQLLFGEGIIRPAMSMVNYDDVYEISGGEYKNFVNKCLSGGIGGGSTFPLSSIFIRIGLHAFQASEIDKIWAI